MKTAAYKDALERARKTDVPRLLPVRWLESKADGNPETVREDDTFIEEELALTALLILIWKAAIEKHNVYALMMAAAASNQLADVEATGNLLSQQLSTAYQDSGHAEEVRKVLETTFDKGLETVGALSALLLLLGTRRRIVDAFERLVAYYANTYFARIVHPNILADLRRNVIALDGDDDFVRIMRQELEEDLFESDPYWRVTANQDVSRSHHYGQLQGMLHRGYLGYEFVAVLDARTTKVCRSLHGRVFWIADALQHLENIANMDSPEDIRQVSPWRTAEDVSGRSNDELRALGVIVPPLHPNCRSTIRPVS